LIEIGACLGFSVKFILTDNPRSMRRRRRRRMRRMRRRGGESASIECWLSMYR
jgi:hypothetical protein